MSYKSVRIAHSVPKFGKNLKSNVIFKSSQSLPRLLGPNEEVQLDYTSLLQDHLGNQMFILVAIDRYSK